MQTIEIMEKTFQAESGDIALYLAMSKKAADEGDNDTARLFFQNCRKRIKSTMNNVTMGEYTWNQRK